jgi:hypothetical protein
MSGARTSSPLCINRGDWTEQRLAELRALWPTRTAAALVEHFGGAFTRNATFAKANRLGLRKKEVTTGLADRFAELVEMVSGDRFGDDGIALDDAARRVGLPERQARALWDEFEAAFDGWSRHHERREARAA